MEEITSNELEIDSDVSSVVSESGRVLEGGMSKTRPETRIERSTGEASFHRRSRKHLKFREKRSFMRMLPNAITLTAFCFGLTAIRFGLFHKWDAAVACVLISAFLDSLDGRVARVIGHSSQFGAELDSLSDLVCFGVAPAILIFLNSLYTMEGFGWGVCIFLAMCCALRLARFNAVLIMGEPQPAWTKKYFTGVPAPAGAAIALFPMILFFATKNSIFLGTIFVVVCALFSGIMMISRVKSFSSKMIEFKEGFASPELVMIGLIIICMMTAPWATLSCLIGTYVVMIPFGAYYYKRYERNMTTAGNQIGSTSSILNETNEGKCENGGEDEDIFAVDQDKSYTLKDEVKHTCKKNDSGNASGDNHEQNS